MELHPLMCTGVQSWGIACDHIIGVPSACHRSPIGAAVPTDITATPAAPNWFRRPFGSLYVRWKNLESQPPTLRDPCHPNEET